MDIADKISSPPETPSSQTEMQLDFSTLPALIEPSPPSNTLLITQLTNPSIFSAPNLQQLQDLFSQHAGAPCHTFSPLKSMRRIIVSFPTVEHAIALRRSLDGEQILGCRVRVYFGNNTPIEIKDQHLHAPDAGRLFFISPPPSPPLGWTMRNEDPPNKAVHADDLASALAKLRQAGGGSAWGSGNADVNGNFDNDPAAGGVPAIDIMDEEGDVSTVDAATRKQAIGAGVNATVVYHPDHHGCHGGLPAVMVEDVSGGEARLEAEKRILTHTARPPVELMVDQDVDMR